MSSKFVKMCLVVIQVKKEEYREIDWFQVFRRYKVEIGRLSLNTPCCRLDGRNVGLLKHVSMVIDVVVLGVSWYLVIGFTFPCPRLSCSFIL